MTYYNPAWNVATTNVTWPIGGHPTISWTPPSAPGFIRVWRATGTSSFASATPISGPLDYGATFTDTAAVEDGVSRFYWAIGYNGNGSQGGQGFSVQALGNNGTATGTTVGSGGDSSDFAPLALPTLSVDTIPQTGAIIRSLHTANCTSYTPGNPLAETVPATPSGLAFIGTGLFEWWMNTTSGVHGVAVNTGMNTPALAPDPVPYEGVWLIPGFQTTGNELTVVPPYSFSPTSSIYVGLVPGGTNGMEVVSGGGATNPPSGIVGSSSASASTVTYLEFTYCSGTSTASVPGDSNQGLGGFTTPVPPGPFPPGFGAALALPPPNPTPLPAIPCCRTEAPCPNPGGQLI